MPHNYLHIWPRRKFMMIALPNQVKKYIKCKEKSRYQLPYITGPIVHRYTIYAIYKFRKTKNVSSNSVLFRKIFRRCYSIDRRETTNRRFWENKTSTLSISEGFYTYKQPLELWTSCDLTNNLPVSSVSHWL